MSGAMLHGCPECEGVYEHAYRCSQWTAKLDGPAPRHGPDPRLIQCEACWAWNLWRRDRWECSPCATCGEQWPPIAPSERRKLPEFRQRPDDEKGPIERNGYVRLGSPSTRDAFIRSLPGGECRRPLTVTRRKSA